MPIPTLKEIQPEFLNLLTDGKEYHIRDVIDKLADKFNLTNEERNRWYESGNDKIFNNYVRFANSNLKEAKLIFSPKRGFVKITNPASDKPLQIFSNESLILDKQTGTKKIEDNDFNPELKLQAAYEKVKFDLKIKLLSILKKVHPSFFEKIVVELLVKMGYGGSIHDAGQAIGKSGDEGIDGIIKEDKLGLDVIYLQAKRWEGVVGRPEIQKFVGALAGQRAKKGVFITTSHFTKEATDFAAQMDTKIVLINGEKLSQLMIDYNLGVSVQNTYEIKKIDTDYFEEE